MAEFSHSGPSHVAMGRFGTTMLVGGETALGLEAKRGEVVRFFLTNTANTRVFRVGIAGAKMKLVGGDSGRVEREELVEDVILAPSERVVVDVQFDAEREAALEHRTPETTYRLASVTVSEDEVEPLDFETLRENADLAAERERIAPYLEAAPDKTLSLVAEMDMGGAGRGRDGRLRLPDARGDRRDLGRQVPEVRDEAHPGRARRGRADGVRLPDAPRDHGHLGRRVPEVRHDPAPDRSRRARGARAPPA